MKKQPMEFEKLLVEWRVKLNMTQGQMAESMKVSQKTVSMWECGKYKATRRKEFEALLWAHEKGLIAKSPSISEEY